MSDPLVVRSLVIEQNLERWSPIQSGQFPELTDLLEMGTRKDPFIAVVE